MVTPFTFVAYSTGEISFTYIVFHYLFLPHNLHKIIPWLTPYWTFLARYSLMFVVSMDLSLVLCLFTLCVRLIAIALNFLLNPSFLLHPAFSFSQNSFAFHVLFWAKSWSSKQERHSFCTLEAYNLWGSDAFNRYSCRLHNETQVQNEMRVCIRENNPAWDIPEYVTHTGTSENKSG